MFTTGKISDLTDAERARLLPAVVLPKDGSTPAITYICDDHKRRAPLSAVKGFGQSKRDQRYNERYDAAVSPVVTALETLHGAPVADLMDQRSAAKRACKASHQRELESARREGAHQYKVQLEQHALELAPEKIFGNRLSQKRADTDRLMMTCEV